MIRIQFSMLIFLLFCFTNLAFAWHGKVIRISDGDTIVVLTDQRQQVKVRLYGVDTPEKRQAFGKAAKKFTARLVGNKMVEVKPVTQDRYGRTVGIVYVGDKCLNQELVANGYAWVYRQYCNSWRLCKRWLQAESKARELKLGLWCDPNPVSPWKWRKNNRKSFITSQTSHKKFSCGQKKYCSQMNSCEEARFYLDVCGLKRLDGDGDGIPCESLCK